MYLVVGLGNPGAEYAGTRHNAGSEAVDRFRVQVDFPAWTYDKYLNARCSLGTIDAARVMLLFPQTMMNRSGEALAAFLKRQPEDLVELVVVHDELDLPVGRLKMVFERGAGGHHGVESIVQALGNNRFVRLRIGISPLPDTAEVRDANAHIPRGRDFVLSRFDKAELDAMEVVFAKSADAINEIVRHGKEVAMQRCNTNV